MTVLVELDLDAIRAVAQQHGVASLSLFGSSVSGGFGDASDIDFLVDFLPGREDPFEDFSALREDLERITRREVDLVVGRAIRNPYFRESAFSRTERIYAADL